MPLFPAAWHTQSLHAQNAVALLCKKALGGFAKLRARL